MAVIKKGNFSYRDPVDVIHDGDTIEDGNFCQAIPDTAILVKVRDLTILDGNWINVKRQPTWTVKGGNWAQISRCTHLNPNLLNRGVAPCAANCAHVVPGATVATAASLKTAAKAAIDAGKQDEARELLARLNDPEREAQSRYADKVIE